MDHVLLIFIVIWITLLNPTLGLELKNASKTLLTVSNYAFLSIFSVNACTISN